MKVAFLSGGVGGARLLQGMADVLPPESLIAIVNTGDDFTHWGLHISPDLDTVMYTLAGLAHEARGWGLAEESFQTLSMVDRYGGESWFQLGDRDLGTHLVRTDLLRRGATLSEVTGRLCGALGILPEVLPMSDLPRQTMIGAEGGRTITFQDWFVRERALPRVQRVWSAGESVPAPRVMAAVQGADVVVIGPSNPYVSIEPILGLDGVRQAVFGRPVIAVSPVVGGKAVKGPLAEMIRDLDRMEPGPAAIVRRYRRLAGMVVEAGDAAGLSGVEVWETSTVMGGREDRARLAREVLVFAESLLSRR